MLPTHSRGTPHARSPSPGGPCLLPTTTTPPPSGPRSETLPVTQSQQPSPSSSPSSNVFVSSTRTTIAAGAVSTASQLQEAESGIATPGGSLRSRQRNRLQLRNAGFRAAPIASRRVSPFHIFTQSRETSPSTQSAARIPKSPKSPAESSILQELHRSSRKKGTQARPSLNGLFQGQGMVTTTPAATHARSVSMSPRTEYLKRSIENEENVPPVSHFSLGRNDSPSGNRPTSLRSSRGSGKIRLSGSHRISRPRAGTGKFRSGGLQVDAYIDSLEAEIASLETRLSTLASPSVNSVQSAKLRSLTAENRNLKQQVSDWERKFDERVEDAVYERTRFEADLHKKIRELEDQVRYREEKYAMLEIQAKDLERRTHRAEECEKLMSSRVDLLTSMVASSPNKERDGWATAPVTPMLNDFPEPLRSPQRIKSALLPPGPNPRPSRSQSPHKRQTITSAEDVFGWHAPAEITEPAQDTSEQVEDVIAEEGCSGEEASVYSMSQSGQQSVLSASTQPTSFDIAEMRSAVGRERPMSLLSTSSFSASWGLPASLGRSYTDGPGPSSTMEPNNKRVSQAKRMRRFHSSAGGLKPLILPSTASSSSSSMTSPRRMSLLSPTRIGAVPERQSTGGYPRSAPVDNIGRDHFAPAYKASSGVSQLTHTSFDPTTAFFESSRESTPLEDAETPSLAAKRRSSEMRLRELERLKALQSLEGNLPDSIDQMIAGITSSSQNSSRQQQDDLNASPLQHEILSDTSGSSLAEELGDSPALSPGSVVMRAPSGNRRPSSSFNARHSMIGWANNMASRPSTPSRPSSPAMTETPRATLYYPEGEVEQDSHGMLPFDEQATTDFDGPILQAPRISIQAGTVSHASSESQVTEASVDHEDTSDPAAGTVFERIARLAAKVVPFRRHAPETPVEAARTTLSNSRPVLLARKILQRSWVRSADAPWLLSPFRLGGLGWWLFGLVKWRSRQDTDRHTGYHRLLANSGNGVQTEGDPEFDRTRPRQVSCATEERQIGLQTNSSDEYTPEQLRRLELDGPFECTMMRAEPQMLFDEQTAMLGLPHLPMAPQHRNYGSVHLATRPPVFETQANSAVDRVLGPSHMMCDYCKEPAARRRLRAWAKFGLALVLAVGVAVLEGPEAVMGEEVQHGVSCKRAKRDSEDYRDDASYTFGDEE